MVQNNGGECAWLKRGGKRAVGRGRVLNWKEIEWAYSMWCLGYTQLQIADALFCSAKTIQRALHGKQRIRPVLEYPEFSNGTNYGERK